MSRAQHFDVTPGYRLACDFPEDPRNDIEFHTSRGCRACLIAGIAAAVNQPTSRVEDNDLGVVTTAVSALRSVRELLDDTDPLRVRAEQALLPLVNA